MSDPPSDSSGTQPKRRFTDGTAPERSRWTHDLPAAISRRQIERVVQFEEDHPHQVLGPALLSQGVGVLIHAFLPLSRQAWVVIGDHPHDRFSMDKIHPSGLYQWLWEGAREIRPYRLAWIDESGHAHESADPYAFDCEISDFDLYLMAEGNHLRSYEKLGAQPKTFQGVAGVQFAVWYPQARSVSVVGNFNHWRAGAHPMSRFGGSEVWWIFIPGLASGEVYKFAVRSQTDGGVRFKSDPYAFGAELRPRTGSVVTALDRFQWQDGAWLAQRARANPLNQPMSIYEVHLGSWKRDERTGWGFLNYRDLAHELVAHVSEMGYTHIELLPVMEHPLDQSWGYQVVNYFAPTRRYGTPEDFMYFVDYCHQHHIGVILDWVPSHFPRDGHGLACDDGQQIYAYENWKRGEHKEWGTFVFDYGRNEVRNFLIANAMFWLERYHIDGLRLDAVASMLYLDYSRKSGEWEPNVYGGRENLEAVSFLKRFNEIVHGQFPGVVTIAEESTAWGGVSRPTYLGGLGFTLKWNMGWMHDTLEYFSKDPAYRKFHQNMLTFSLLYAFSENFVLPISHDEVVHGKRALLEKMPGDDWQKFANLRLFYGYMFAHPGKKLLFMGSDFAQRDEWRSDHSLDWHFLKYDPHRQVARFLQDLHRIYRTHRAFYEVDFGHAGFEWIDFSDTEASIINFIRWSRDNRQMLLVTCNMTPVPRMRYRIGAPKEGFYREILNSDSPSYGGSGIGNFGGVHSEPVPWHGRPFSVAVNLPPLGVNIYKWEGV